MNVESYLVSKDIEFKKHEHPAVFTCEEAEEHCGMIPGLACKNLFLRNKKKTRFLLVVLSAKKQADLKKVSELAGDKFGFASPDLLKEKLDLEPGSVSPFGLLNNHEHDVEVYVDETVYHADIVSFHPNRNTATLELTGPMFQKFLEIIPNSVTLLR
ncbi:prolyl-tRNA synthetase associated domain-containing protein [Candidatus Peregrinibacteria bacterium]|nr:MAG: prolyl-tRNA synthetase associated domain-containing protein [Candidatus Peregrinibacteria bacterium]